jgi:hypothetical protein
MKKALQKFAVAPERSRSDESEDHDPSNSTTTLPRRRAMLAHHHLWINWANKKQYGNAAV